MYKTYRVIALICCRGGSKGIPGKNIRDFAGKPLLAWTLEAARAANVFDEILLSTDSAEIAQVGRSCQATVPGLRPAHLAQDKSDQFETHKYIFQLLNITDETHRICVLNNNPFLGGNLIRNGYEKATATNFQHIVLDAVRVGGDYLYFRQCFENVHLLWHYFPKTMLESQINRQTMQFVYASINNMRWGKPSVLDTYEHYKQEIVQRGFLPVCLPKTRNFELDDEEDWVIAEAVFKRLHLA